MSSSEPHGAPKMANQSNLIELFNRWERVWHEGQFDLIVNADPNLTHFPFRSPK
jgi:hypothetical protein